MAGFYNPFTFHVNGKPIIVYPCTGLEKVLSRETKGSIEKHLQKLYQINAELQSTGVYHIIILWNEEADVMTDVWIFDQVESWGSGPLVDVKIFRNMSIESGIGVSAGDGLLMLGREEELRRSSKSLETYLSGPRASLPIDIKPREEF